MCAALGDPARLRLLVELFRGECTVSDLAGAESLSTVSQRLTQLRRAGLIRRRQEGKYAYYSLAAAWVKEWVREALARASEVELGEE